MDCAFMSCSFKCAWRGAVVSTTTPRRALARSSVRNTAAVKCVTLSPGCARGTLSRHPEQGNARAKVRRSAVICFARRVSRGWLLHVGDLAVVAAVAQRRQRRVVLVFDEFQEIVALDPELPARMRATFQFQPNVAHVYLGSRQGRPACDEI